MIFDHYLAVSTWSPKFISSEARVTKTLAWIRIPGLNVVFYDESFLMSVAKVIGTPIRVDMHTLRGDRGWFARICAELDLTKLVIGKIGIEDYWYKVEYEGLHIICPKCGCYGHRGRECSLPTPAKESVSVSVAKVSREPVAVDPGGGGAGDKRGSNQGGRRNGISLNLAGNDTVGDRSRIKNSSS